MASNGSLPNGSNNPAPAEATAAVLHSSDPVPEGSQAVNGINFDDYTGRDITVSELVNGMKNMGFQASAVGEAVRIINDMVRPSYLRRAYSH